MLQSQQALDKQHRANSVFDISLCVHAAGHFLLNIKYLASWLRLLLFRISLVHTFFEGHVLFQLFKDVFEMQMGKN